MLLTAVRIIIILMNSFPVDKKQKKTNNWESIKSIKKVENMVALKEMKDDKRER